MLNNGVMLQSFSWYMPSDGEFYNHLKEMAETFHHLGITGIWMPPAAKGTSQEDVGYGNYDYWDLGEFDQKGTIRTKYGTRKELEACIEALQNVDIQVYADMVFNHKGGADEKENFQAILTNPENRLEDISEPQEITGWTKFTFPNRKGKYSDFIWRSYHFTGVDYDEKTKNKGIYRILGDGKYWAKDGDGEKGNYDYLMAADIDHRHPEVIEELEKVSDFMIDQMGYDGFRYDALKHISPDFIDHLSKYILEKHPNFYFVGEYWRDDQGSIDYYLNQTDYKIDLFDVPLHYNFYEAGMNPDYDMRKIFQGSLVEEKPLFAVTFVDNHDTEEGQSLSSWVGDWFKEIAYGLILLRKDGYPCLFMADYLGGFEEKLEKMLLARKTYALGDQDDYFVSPSKIGWVRRGEHPLAVLISTGEDDQEKMFVGLEEKGKIYQDLSGKREDVVIDEEGFGLFTVGERSISYYGAKL